MKKLAKIARLGLAALIVGSVSACGGSLFGDKEKPLASQPADVMYKQGEELMAKERYAKAAEVFEEIDRQHPYSPEARQGMLKAALAYQKAGKLPEAVAAARRYLTLHPGTKEAAFAQEIIAASYFERMGTPGHDQSETKKAVGELETLIRRYPDSEFSQEARKHVKTAKDVLAASEMNIGRWYQKKGNYLAAVNRFRVVVSDYQQTAHVEEALMRLTECYMALGVVNEAQTAAAILGNNYPNGEWYKSAYELLKSKGAAPQEDQGSWVSRTWKKAGL